MYFSERSSKALRVLLSVAAILLPAALAGLRDNSVGTDLRVYVDPIWNFSLNLHSFDYEGRYEDDIEVSYLALNYFLSRFFTNEHWLYFVIAIIDCSVVFFAFKNLKMSKTLWVGWTAFLFLYFPVSFNNVRQFLAMSILLYASTFVIRRQWIFFLLGVLLAYSFHHSALIGLIILPIIFLSQNSTGKVNFKKPLVFLLITGFCIMGGTKFLEWALNINDKYEVYLNNDKYISGFPIFSINSLIYIVLTSILLFWKTIKFTKVYIYFLFVCIGFCLETYLSSTITFYLGRLGYYFSFFLVFLVSFLWDSFSVEEINYKTIYILKVLIILNLVLDFYFVFIRYEQHQVSPYTSHLLTNFIGL